MNTKRALFCLCCILVTLPSWAVDQKLAEEIAHAKRDAATSKADIITIEQGLLDFAKPYSEPENIAAANFGLFEIFIRNTGKYPRQVIRYGEAALSGAQMDDFGVCLAHMHVAEALSATQGSSQAIARHYLSGFRTAFARVGEKKSIVMPSTRTELADGSLELIAAAQKRNSEAATRRDDALMLTKLLVYRDSFREKLRAIFVSPDELQRFLSNEIADKATVADIVAALKL